MTKLKTKEELLNFMDKDNGINWAVLMGMRSTIEVLVDIRDILRKKNK